MLEIKYVFLALNKIVKNRYTLREHRYLYYIKIDCNQLCSFQVPVVYSIKNDGDTRKEHN